MKATLTFLALAGMLVEASASAAEPAAFPRSTPEAQGIRSSAVLAFIDAAEKQAEGLHSLMIVRHGHVVAEGWWQPYERADPHTLWSLSKSFTSTSVGLAVAEGRLSIDDPVLKFFPDEVPAQPSDNLKAMRVRDLLAMSSGHHSDVLEKFSYGSPGVVRAFLALPVAHKPGTHWVYNTPATYMLSAIVQKATGATVLDYLRPRLFEPLGIRNPTWWTSADGVSLGGTGLNVTTEDIARFLQLYLQRGTWRGKQLVPADWVAAATSRQASNGSNPKSDWEQGYGYQFWRNRHNSYRGDGAYGQFGIVLPELDSVIAITAGFGDMQDELNLVWDHLRPGIEPRALPAADEDRKRLEERLRKLSLTPQDGSATSPMAREITGKRYNLPANDAGFESVGVDRAADGRTALVVRAGGQDRRLKVIPKTWTRGATLRVTSRDQPAAASGGWTSHDTYAARVCLYETSFCSTLRLQFAGDKLIYEQEGTLTFGGSESQKLIGKLQDAYRYLGNGAVSK